MNNGVAQLPRTVNFALENNQAEQSIYFCRRNAKDDYTEIGSLAFLSELKKGNFQEILIYIHGYSNLPEPAIFPRAEELQRLFDQKSPNYMVVVPLIWPCDDDLGAVKDYFDDQIAADQSGVAFARLLQKFIDWRERNSKLSSFSTNQPGDNPDDAPCIKRINILAHSMGNRTLRAALARSVDYFLPIGIPLLFRNIFMAAADIENTSLEPDREGRHIPESARNVVVYFAADDLAMRASKVANMGDRGRTPQTAPTNITTRRMGHTGPAKLERVPKNVYALDCADFNTDYDPPVGHGYFASDPQSNPGLLFEHMWRCIQTGRVPMNPPLMRTTILNSVFWR